MAKTELFEAPRWKGGPRICMAENLPALPTMAALDKLQATDYPGASVIHKWQCEHCRMFHAYVVGPDPGGGSSGTGRSKKTPGGMAGFKVFFKAKSPVELHRFMEADEAKKEAAKQARK